MSATQPCPYCQGIVQLPGPRRAGPFTCPHCSAWIDAIQAEPGPAGPGPLSAGEVPDFTRDVGKPLTSAELILWGFVSVIAGLGLLLYTVVGTGNRGVVTVLAALLGVAVVAAIVFALWSPAVATICSRAVRGERRVTVGQVIGLVLLSSLTSLCVVIVLTAVCAGMMSTR
jgi:hypothetical protein